MIWQFRFHGTHHGDVVDAFSDLGKEGTDRNTALPIGRESKRRGKGRARLAFGAKMAAGQGLPRVVSQGRFGIEGIDMGWPPIEKEMDDASSPSTMMGTSGGERIARRFLAQQGTEPYQAHAHPALPQKVTAADSLAK